MPCPSPASARVLSCGLPFDARNCLRTKFAEVSWLHGIPAYHFSHIDSHTQTASVFVISICVWISRRSIYLCTGNYNIHCLCCNRPFHHFYGQNICMAEFALQDNDTNRFLRRIGSQMAENEFHRC